MKIVIAHDGSPPADAAINDLYAAGLPDDVEALVLTVAELWLPPPSFLGAGVPLDDVAFSSRVEEALAMARGAAERLGSRFPRWRVHSEATSGSAATEVLKRAEEWKSRLIVVGSHGRSGLSRLFFGSVSHGILTRAHSSVRVGRRAAWQPEAAAGDSTRPLRILVGFDGSHGAQVAVREVAERRWPAGTEVRLLTCMGPFPSISSFEGGLTDAILVEPGVAEEVSRAKALLEVAARPLERARLNVAISVCIGDPKRRLVDEAESWKADTVFVGSTGLSRLERLFLGSVAAAVAAHAGSTVEIVRPSFQ